MSPEQHDFGPPNQQNSQRTNETTIRMHIFIDLSSQLIVRAIVEITCQITQTFA